jgi:ribonuclease R
MTKKRIKKNRADRKKMSGTHELLQSLKTKIKQLLNAQAPASFTEKHLIKKLGFRQQAVNNLIPAALKELVTYEHIRLQPDGTYTSLQDPDYVEGRVDHVNSRFAYIVTAKDEEDIYVKTQHLMGAIDGDTVRVAVTFSPKGRKQEGKVVEIVKRAKTEFVGRIEFSPRFAFVVPDNRKIHQDFFLPKAATLDAQPNDKVIVEVVEWPKGDESPVAKVIRVLGKAGENDVEIHSIMAEFGLPFEFPEKVLEESKKIADDITAEEIRQRKDFREVLTFTIDPEDAKDFDDAISFRLLENGHFEVGVHIADVTHYVRPKTQLEKEAIERATSVYLVDRTIPMLPERLSNELCSLRPNEDKLTFAAVFELDEKARIQKEWFGRTIIHSRRRFSYEEAQQRIETAEGDLSGELITLNHLALELRKARFAKGAVNFESTEVKFVLDEKGKPLGITPKVRKDAHKLVEEFMLLANKQVATFVYNMRKGKEKNTFVYRTHDYPDPEKVSNFALFAKKFGHEVKIEETSISQSLNSLMDEIEGKPEQNVLQALAIRAMAKAKYTTDPKGHFGLAFAHYTHFTSPIRRYPDMMVHRLLQHYLDNGKSMNADEFEEKCEHSSEREKRAADSERASIKYKQVEFMQTMKDRPFEGIISGITEWGIYVEIVETKCEGMVRMADLKDDFYEFDEKNYRIIGRSNKKIYTLGDTVTVKVTKTDIDRRTIDLAFADKEEA